MTKPEAHDLLNLVRAGGLAPLHRIAEALSATGDLCRHRVHVGDADPLPFISFPAIPEDAEPDSWPVAQKHRAAGQCTQSDLSAVAGMDLTSTRKLVKALQDEDLARPVGHGKSIGGLKPVLWQWKGKA
jgi:hypothetical protein